MSTQLIGFLAAFCTTIAFLPQTVKCLRSGDTTSISLLMYIFFTIGIILWLCYGVLLNDWALISANFITATLAFCILALKVRNDILRPSNRSFIPFKRKRPRL